MGVIFNPFTGNFDFTGGSGGGGGTPGGSDQDIQWNDANSFAGGGLKFDPVTGNLLPLIVTGNTASIFANINNFYNDGQKWMQIGSDGLPRFVYIANSYTELHFVQFLNADGSSIIDSILVTDMAGNLDNPEFVLTSDDLPRISYVSYTDGLHFIKCTSQDGTTNTDVPLGTTTGLYEQSIDIDSNNIPYIVFNNYDDNTLQMVVCSNDAGAVLTITEMATSATSSISGIKIGSDDLPRLVYTNNSNEVHFIQCQNATGTMKVDNLVDTINQCYYLEMVLNAVDNPLILYSDNNGNGVRYAQGADNAGASFNLVSLYPAHTNTYQCSIALGLDGFPRISFSVYNGSSNVIFYGDFLSEAGDSVTLAQMTFNSAYVQYNSIGMNPLTGLAKIIYMDGNNYDLYIVNLVTQYGGNVRSGIGTVSLVFQTTYSNVLITQYSSISDSITLATAVGGFIDVSTADASTNSNAGQISLHSGNGNGTGNGGDITFYTGNGGTTGAAGTFNLQTGSGSSSGGNLNISTGNGNSLSGTGGTIQLTAGNGPTGGGATSVGGGINIYAGLGSTGGDVTLHGGVAYDDGNTGGNISLFAGSINGSSGGGGQVQIFGGSGHGAGNNSTNGGGVNINGGNASDGINGGNVRLLGGTGGSNSGNGGDVIIAGGNYNFGGVNPGKIKLSGNADTGIYAILDVQDIALSMSDQTFTFPQQTGELLVAIGGTTTTAPTTTATPVFTAYYGGNNKALGDPVAWAQMDVGGTLYKIPLYT